MKRAKMKCQIFVDPIYGSERFIEFDPAWVVEAEDRYFKLALLSRMVTRQKQRPVTFIRFRNGQHHLVDGHWAERIKAAQAEKEANDEVEANEVEAAKSHSEGA